MNTSINNSFKIVTWSILAGALVALSIEVVLNFLGIGLGLSSIDMSASSLFKAGSGSVIWLALTGIVSMAFGGWIAGVICNCECSWTRAMHGLLAWSLATLVAISVTTSAAGILIGGPTSIVSSSIKAGDKKLLNTIGQYANPTSSSNPNTDNSDKTVDKATNDLAKASIAIFFAFLLSAIAGITASICAKPKMSDS